MSSPSKLPQLTPEQRKELERYSQLVQQLDFIRLQIQQQEVEKRDVETALKETSNLAPDTVIYRSAGRILYQTTVDAVKKYLSEEREKLDVRINSLRSREQKLLSAIKELQSKLSSQLQPK